MAKKEPVELVDFQHTGGAGRWLLCPWGFHKWSEVPHTGGFTRPNRRPVKCQRCGKRKIKIRYNKLGIG